MLMKKGAYLITDENTRLYFCGFRATEGFVLFIDEDKYFFVDRRYYYAAKNRLKGSGFNVVDGVFKDMTQLLIDRGVTELFVDYTKTTLDFAQQLTLCGFKLADCHDEVKEARIVKTERELKLIKRACVIAEKAFKATLPEIKEGITESEVAAILEGNFKKFGAEKPSFDTIIAFGPNSAVPHHETGATKLKVGDVVLMDFGCLYKGYCSDITRTMFFGKPTKEFKAVYNAVKESHEAAHDGIREGMSGIACDGIARNYLKEKGYDKFFTHSLGHGIGVDIHEDPYLSPKGERSIVENNVFSIEPGVYLDGKFGVRIENTCTLRGGKVESLVSLSKELKVLKP